jgi:hypothetical protein
MHPLINATIKAVTHFDPNVYQTKHVDAIQATHTYLFTYSRNHAIAVNVIMHHDYNLLTATEVRASPPVTSSWVK